MRIKEEWKYAISVIAYNREQSLKRLLVKLSQCKYYGDTVDLIIRIDKSDNTQVEDVADNFVWNFGDKIIAVAEECLGLKKNILGCGKLLEKYDAIAVFEDDIVPSKYFYHYMRHAVPMYIDNTRIAGISLYSYRINQRVKRPFEPLDTKYDTFFIQHAVSWGQIWLNAAWNDFNAWYQKKENKAFASDEIPLDICTWGEKSWLKYHIKYCIEEDKYFVMPYISLSTNYHCIGEHSVEESSMYQVPMCREEKDYAFMPFDERALKYDVYFENISIWKELGFSQSDVTIDLYGNKTIHARFWLTSKKADYRILDKFGLRSRPIETNIIDHQEGDYFTLYDTSSIEKNKVVHDKEIVAFNYDVSNFISRALIFKLLHYNFAQTFKKYLRW